MIILLTKAIGLISAIVGLYKGFKVYKRRADLKKKVEAGRILEKQIIEAKTNEERIALARKLDGANSLR